MLLSVNLSTGDVTGSSVYVHDLGSVGRIYCSGRWRLDNRDELLGRLRLPPNASDAELIVQAYLAYGESHPELLLGDFAYALYDGRERQLWLVRDHMGVMPLYYHRAGGLCIASPSLDALLSQPDIPRTLNDGVVAEWCVNGHVYNQVDTFHATIKKVPRATCLRLTATSQRAGVYWSPANVPPLVETREPALVEQLRDLIQTAILCRLGTTGGQAAHLSGGLDSTPIAIVAGRACRRHGRDFHTYNWCRPEAGDAEDWHEWADARQVARDEGFTHCEIGPTSDTLLEDLLNHDLARDGTAMFSYERHIVLQARPHGVNRIFSGFGGDEILTTCWRDRHQRALRAGRFWEVWRRLAMESNLTHLLSWPRMARRYARLLKSAWVSKPHTWRGALRRHETSARYRLGLLQPEFAAYATGLSHDNSAVFLGDSITERQIAVFDLGYHQERMETWALLGERQAIDYVYPYLDKRLVEFALALPSEWYFRHGWHRYLYRRALDHCLTEAMKTKGKPKEIRRVQHLTQHCRAALLQPQMLEHVADASSPYIDPQSLSRQLTWLRQIDPLHWEQNSLEVLALFECALTLTLER